MKEKQVHIQNRYAMLDFGKTWSLENVETLNCTYLFLQSGALLSVLMSVVAT